jgi:hypothetical protein
MQCYYVAPHLRSGGISEKDPFFLTTSPSRSKIGQEAYDHFLLCEPSLKGITLDECSRPDRYLSLIFHIVRTAAVHVSTLRKLVLPDACEHLAQHESVIRSHC